MNQPVEIVSTTAAHVRDLGAKMRESDKREAIGLGFLPHRLLFRSFRSSLSPKTALIDGKVAAIWGCMGVPMGEIGHPWLVTSDAVFLRSPIDYALLYRQEVKKMLELFPLLENWVDSNYDESIRLMKIVGFKVDNPVPRGPNKALFRRFWMRA